MSTVGRIFLLVILVIALPLQLQAKLVKKQIYGRVESVHIPEINILLPAKLDTGAETSSLNAKIVKIYEKNKRDWVKFIITNKDKRYTLDKPLVRISKIKNRIGEIDEDDERYFETRPVINLSICMNGKKQVIQTNLTDRSSFIYPLLLGRKALIQFKALIDSSKTFTHSKTAVCDE